MSRNHNPPPTLLPPGTKGYTHVHIKTYPRFLISSFSDDAAAFSFFIVALVAEPNPSDSAPSGADMASSAAGINKEVSSFLLTGATAFLPQFWGYILQFFLQ